ncbi:MAG: TonB-dependent receptor [Bacteroidales bacterium]|nr:TonB-dependent receptor [Bacteroidales bacterium]
MRKTKTIALLLAIMLGTFFSSAQEVLISGTVKDKSGSPLPGVNVVNKGTTVGVVTDANGNYRIRVTDSKATLVFSFIGYKTVEQSVSGRTTVDVVLEEETKELEEVVVVGYGVQKRSDLTGAVASVKAEEIAKIPTAGIANALQGKVAGVMITQTNGAPGASTKVRVRGISSINAGEPIWIVDGVPASPNSVNENDIESIEILKDAASGAIYGASGANGVVLVTTKKGKPGDTRVEANYYHGFQEAPKYISVANSEEYGKMFLEYQAITALAKNQTTISSIKFPNYKTEPTYDYQNMIFRLANIDKFDVSASGGNEKLTAYFSGSYYKEEGILKSSSYEKMIFSLKTNYKVNDWLRVGENASYTYTSRFGWDDWVYNNEYNSPITAAIQVLPNHAPYDSTGNWRARTWGNSDGPMPAVDQMNQKRNNYEARATFFAIVEPIKGLTFESNMTPTVSFNNNYNLSVAYYYGGGPGQYNNTSKINRSMGQYFSYNWQNLLRYKKTLVNKINLEALGGFEVGKEKYMDIQGERWNLMFEDPTNWKLLVQHPEMWYFNASTNDTSLSQLVRGGGYESAGYSYIGRLNLDYESKYLFQFNFRRDYSSKFGPNNRYGNFPGFSLGWKFTEEQFVKDALPFISFGKIRYSWGRSGNNAVDNYAYYSTIGAVNGYRYSLNNTATLTRGAAPDVFPNTEIHWEDIETQNLGIDLQFLNNRLGISIDRFNRHNIGMLIRTTLPGYAGWLVRDTYQESNNVDPRPFINAGKFTNKGWETTLSWRESRGNFDYSVELNYTYVKNIATDLGPDSVRTTGTFMGFTQFCRTETGGDIGNFYGFQVERIFQTSDLGVSKGKVVVTNQPYSINSKGDTIYMQPKAAPGDFKFKDLNGDGKLTDADKTVIGNPFPKHLFGLTFNFSYKFIDFTMFWQGSFGNKIINFTKYYGFNQSGLYNWNPDYINNHYRATDIVAKDAAGNTLEVFPANPNAKYPRLDPVNANGNFDRFSDFYVEDGSYVRLRNVQIAFRLPNNAAFRKLSLSEMKIFVGAKNLLTFTKYTGMDPEVPQDDPLTAGIDKAGYPVARSYVVGATIKF